MNTMKKSLVLAAAIAALSAIAIPSMATAANWGPLNTIHTLTSPSSITFNIPGLAPSYAITCSSGPTFTSQVRTPASPLMDLTSTTSLPCIVGTNGNTVTLDMVGLPLWNADGTSGTNNVKINSVNIQGKYTGGINFTISGTLAGGVWNSLTRSLAFTNGTGLTYTPPGGQNFPVTVTASEFIKDTTSPFVSLM
jgi:hypothetical protein